MIYVKTVKPLASTVFLAWIIYKLSNMETPADIFFMLAMILGKKGIKGVQPGPPLSWLQRVKIAVSAAKSLEFLHKKVDAPTFMAASSPATYFSLTMMLQK